MDVYLIQYILIVCGKIKVYVCNQEIFTVWEWIEIILKNLHYTFNSSKCSLK